MSGSPWWREAVIYQVYVKSFADSDGDGIGDLDGIPAKLDHLVRLGVDGLWLNPCYPSPDHDMGFNNSADAPSWGYAAKSYSLISQPRIFVRVIRWAGTG